ncbi:hypothetical protein [Pseudarthrobacter sp. N5]|uniref:hypothetical protein n=1 Tax=Pseudarthrobacter sp. N5 TaxID=3418416 RepID=UPI003CE9A2C9
MDAIQMLSGAAMSAVLALLLVLLVLRERRPLLLATVFAAAFVMPVFWNSILGWTGAMGLFSHDLPFAFFPVSWQDTGSGMFALAGASVAVAVGPGRRDPAVRTGYTALLAASAALIVDVYLY